MAYENDGEKLTIRRVGFYSGPKERKKNAAKRSLNGVGLMATFTPSVVQKATTH